jgi:hypothetical protein
VWGVIVVLVFVVVVVVCAAVRGGLVLRKSYVLRGVVGVWGCALGRGCGVVVLEVVEFSGRGVGADVDSGVLADVDVDAMWVWMDICVGGVGGILGALSVVVDGGFGCFVDTVVGGMVWCRSLSIFPI